jgi:hypothetical protein
MNSLFKKLLYAFKAFHQLGWKQTTLYAWYRLLLLSGWLKIISPKTLPTTLRITPLDIPLPSKETLKEVLGLSIKKLYQEADEIIAGKVRLFGNEPVLLNLTPKPPLEHWTAYHSPQFDGQDIKLTWEPGRFGWAAVLARAYYLSEDEKYAQAFWEHTETFLHANPPHQGPHWSSAQEVALRLIALAFCFPLIQDSQHTNPYREKLLAQTLAAHAQRIPPTLVYARAQNNNHLLTEAVGLYTAAAVLPVHPQARRWCRLGWKWFNHGLQTQIEPDGAYVQHSANYHRLMLQAALWGGLVAESRGDKLPQKTAARLSAATGWLAALLDEKSGKVPNLGPNDGAYILPPTVCGFEDYRPVLQAACLAFSGQTLFPAGEWDEMALWLSPTPISAQPSQTPNLIRLESENSWGYLRAAQFKNRPGHADQLHLDLWWRGLNIAQDAGTYLYNADPPWQNPFSSTAAHNTLTINGQDQMTPAGRFLWLDWAQAEVIEHTPTHAIAQHNGYRRLGITHRREVEVTGPDSWKVTDSISSSKPKPCRARLHWLLPDWPWKLDASSLELDSPLGVVKIFVACDQELEPSLARAGELLHGSGEVEPTRGWFSPTYAHKTPALSFVIKAEAPSPINLITTWEFPYIRTHVDMETN